MHCRRSRSFHALFVGFRQIERREKAVITGGQTIELKRPVHVRLKRSSDPAGGLRSTSFVSVSTATW